MEEIKPVTLFFLTISLNTLYFFLTTKPNIIYKCLNK